MTYTKNYLVAVALGLFATGAQAQYRCVENGRTVLTDHVLLRRNKEINSYKRSPRTLSAMLAIQRTRQHPVVGEVKHSTKQMSAVLFHRTRTPSFR